MKIFLSIWQKEINFFLILMAAAVIAILAGIVITTINFIVFKDLFIITSIVTAGYMIMESTKQRFILNPPLHKAAAGEGG